MEINLIQITEGKRNQLLTTTRNIRRGLKARTWETV